MPKKGTELDVQKLAHEMTDSKGVDTMGENKVIMKNGKGMSGGDRSIGGGMSGGYAVNDVVAGKKRGGKKGKALTGEERMVLGLLEQHAAVIKNLMKKV